MKHNRETIEKGVKSKVGSWKTSTKLANFQLDERERGTERETDRQRGTERQTEGGK